ncbi:MazG-like family protein [Paractinoplanes rishiriensis]|uniref:Uncharacterized protein n=1 Tax=Paractinoplanes rishiriensis TaxID=1050105 RepID=A0A919KDE4_9ACTN|nr:MazG-like family protein [Actinoplanes rishiriensis]GIF02342.1 hypothetical protein Ari01nite_98060 [Actinoplanes rishiriensis]
MTTITDAARRLAAQLDQRGNPDLAGLPETLCRALKVQEEAGEMAQAVIGVLGQNPRKGTTHTWDDVVAEAIDTALSALVLAETVQPGMLGLTLAGSLDRLARRAATTGAPDVEQAPDTVTADGEAGRQRATTLRWLLDTHTEHDLPLPENLTCWDDPNHLRIELPDDHRDGVRGWAALLGLAVEENTITQPTCSYQRVRAESPYRSDVTSLGWQHVIIQSRCDRTPAPSEVTPQAVAA